MRFLPLDKLINVQEGYRKRFKIDSTDLILSKENDQIVAFGAVCPHQEQSLEEGHIEGGVIYCPRHQFAFSLETGQHIAGHCRSLPIYEVHYEGNEVGILLEG
jgi:nitrite reductase/ring-hydroxylating ferredoxin subunit